jgi:GNAT superfamily N-acetyltransferase
MAEVRELRIGQTGLGFAAMRELRAHLTSVDEFVRRVDEVQRPQGYRLVGSFEPDVEEAAAVAGFWTSNCLSAGFYLYVDDLVTREAFRRRGHSGGLLEWMVEEAQRLGCEMVRLDSATHRHVAHRFYLNHGMDIVSFHFLRAVDRA